MDTEKEQRGRGQPTIYNPELRAELCLRLASGRTLRSVCRDDDMPCRRTVTSWLLLDYEKKEDHPAVHDDFLRHYTRAREEQTENVHDEIVEIADDGSNDYIELEMKNGKKKMLFDKEHVQRSRLRVDARLSWLANTEPKKYGKNIKVESQALGKDGKPTDPAPGIGCEAFMEAATAEIEKRLKRD